MQVLLVEDHTDSRAVLNTLLNRCGCRTVTAKNFKEACARLDQMRFDILIADLCLPDGDGLDLVGVAGGRGVRTVCCPALRGREEWMARFVNGQVPEVVQPFELGAPDALGATLTEVKVHRDPECPICSREPDAISDDEMGVFPDYEAFCAAAG